MKGFSVWEGRLRCVYWGDLLCIFIKGAGCHKCAFKGCVVLGGLNSHLGYYLVKQLVMSKW